MEQQARTESLPESFGKRSFRHWLGRAGLETQPNLRVAHLSRALEVAPGCRDCWFALGDTFMSMGKPNQAAQSFRGGLAVTRPELVSVQVRRIANLPNDLMLRAVGDHLGAARIAAELREKATLRDFNALFSLDQMHRDMRIRKSLYLAIDNSRFDKSVMVPLLWRIAQRGPVYSSESVALIARFEHWDPNLDLEHLLVRLAESDRAHCQAVGAWADRDKMKLVAVLEHLEDLCTRHLLGQGVPLGVLGEVRLLRAP